MRTPSFSHVRMEAEEPPAEEAAAPAEEAAAPAEEKSDFADSALAGSEGEGGNIPKNLAIFAVLAAVLIFQRGGLEGAGITGGS